jgi:tubulin polyglutamylase TTLL1
MTNTPKSTGLTSSSSVTFRLDSDRTPLTNNFYSRGWKPWDGVSQWNLYWTSAQQIRSVLEDEGRLGEDQIINHFPTFAELTRKDSMFKHIRRYCRARAGAAGGGDPRWDFMPQTLILPHDLALFEEEHKRHPVGTKWIAKPTGGSQGKRIFIFQKRKDVKQWLTERETKNGDREPYVISRYLMNPLLIGGRKFDLRIYVLVLSFSPLRALKYREAFARFCASPYNEDDPNLDVHLTNVAVQKQNEDYNATTGGKWNIDNLFLFLEATYGHEATQRLQENIDFILLTSLRAVQGVMNNDPHSFELYGYDVLIDRDLKPWLIEVNASPSLTPSNEWDERRKTRLVRDVLNLVIPPGFPSEGAANAQFTHGAGAASTSRIGSHIPYSSHRRTVTEPLGGFEFLVDEMLYVTGGKSS